ncbi:MULTISPECIES: ADP compounds hydrolase NudE [Ectothiorhodospira]|uniref:ADP-ribose diphosphatase n=1 Tax=Ectothiorhodospira haloalkaliphila TaxID=421628 RepID=W8L8Q8_9GAMM|nr:MULTISPECIES: ADP compounds hydrolase NudE [Ectothiorhodospira]AHK80215.1 ADP-ribose diphosphatase [Ectothiorhodospira haloalkaliphila]ANB01954.1 ADP-ribose diphosphatase [Ectothiorhodospira sp. BSL-9]TVQ73532.1 MAG: ADP compounds hydrolase NudE [Chromatiaceae bacterium]
MPQKPQILSRRTVARSRLFHVEELELLFANGARTRFERLVGSGRGAVLIVPMLDDDTVLLIREYAAGTQRYELGLPKGLVEQGEELLEAANREIMEEVGYGARQLDYLTALTVAPGYLSHSTHVILARDLYPERLPGDEPEDIQVVPWKLSQLDQLIALDDCTEARSIAALYMARDQLSRTA